MSIKSEINFCTKLLKVLNSDESIVYSPASIFSVLSMIYAGTDGITADELNSIIGRGKSFAEIIKYYSDFIQYYKDINNATDDNNDGDDGEIFQLLFSNCLFLSKTPLLPSFKELMKNFGDKYAQVDFADTEKSAKAINDFVAENTKQKITSIIENDEINEKTSIFIVNALSFIGKWEEPFEEEKEGIFFSNPSRNISMITQNACGMEWNLTVGDEWKCLGIPYKFRKSWLHILLPNKRDGLQKLIKKLDYSMIKECVENNPVDYVEATIPTFQIESKMMMNEKMKQMGIQQLFDGHGITEMFDDNEQHFLDVAIHAAKIEVDRYGTTGSAATACGIKLNADFEKEIFIADHPFIFFITLTEEDSPEDLKTILLMGTYC